MRVRATESPYELELTCESKADAKTIQSLFIGVNQKHKIEFGKVISGRDGIISAKVGFYPAPAVNVASLRTRIKLAIKILLG